MGKKWNIFKKEEFQNFNEITIRSKEMKQLGPQT